MRNKILLFSFLYAISTSHACYSSENKKIKKDKRLSWASSEYSEGRSKNDIRTAMLSKGFAWLSGSPADNQMLSIGKSAQFFGFVAFRYESGRAAKRGAIGRAFFQLATSEQRALMVNAVRQKAGAQERWLSARNKIMNRLEATLYAGQTVDATTFESLGIEYGVSNAETALHEARAIAGLERSLTNDQRGILSTIRSNPDIANQMTTTQHGLSALYELSDTERAELEDLFAKAFSWITGTFKHRQITPKGQPAQFFGFVAIRHKSGRGAHRGEIAKSFDKILDDKQRNYIEQAILALSQTLNTFTKTRTAFLKELEQLRQDPTQFDVSRYTSLARELGLIEIECARIEADVYVRIARGLTNEQEEKMMALRSNYIVNTQSLAELSLEQRGQKILNLCISCHNKQPALAPDIGHVLGKAIARQNYDYSTALKQYATQEQVWTALNLDRFLMNPQKTVPGTTMAFKGLTNEKDRLAVIELLK